MDIERMIKKLRAAADGLEKLLEQTPTAAKAEQVRKSLVVRTKPHWTQTPEGKKKLAKASVKGVKTRARNKAVIDA